MRLIDADKLKKEVIYGPPELCYTFEFVDLIDKQPAVKIVEDKLSAQWLINSDGYYPYCSHCKNEPQGRVMTDYCPNCGAYMKNDK